MATLSELNVKIGADISAFEQKLEKASKKLADVGQGFKDIGGNMSKWVSGPIAGATAGLLAVAKSTGDFADSVLDQSDITGMSTDSIQKWQAVTKQAGVNIDAMTGAAQKLTRNMNILRNGTGKQSEALARLGVDFETLEAATPDERMTLLVNELGKIEDKALRAELGTDLLGGSYKEIAPIISLGADEIERIGKTAEEAGAVMSNEALNDANNFRRGMEDLKESFTGAGRSIMSEFMPILTNDVMPLVKEKVIPAMKEFAEKVKGVIEWFTNLSPSMQKAIVVGVGLAAALGPILIVVGQIITTIGALIPVIKGVGMAFSFLAAGPIGWVIAAIAGIILIGVLLWKNWDKVKEFVLKSWEAIKSAALTIFSLLKGFFKKWGPEIIAILLGPIGILVGIFNGKFGNIKEKVIGVLTDIAEKGREKIGELASWIKDGLDKIVGFFKGIGKKLKIKIPKPKLPKFSISGKFSLMPPSIPKIGVNWYAKGGLFDGASVVGVGEKGPEAVVPLQGHRMKPFADAIAGNIETNRGAEDSKNHFSFDPIYIHIAGEGASNLDQNAIARAVEERIIKQIVNDSRRLPNRNSISGVR